MTTASPPAETATAQRIPLWVKVKRFWHRVTEGLEVSQLWSQFETDARTSYRLYSRDVAANTQGVLPGADTTCTSSRNSSGPSLKNSRPRAASCCWRR